MLQLNPAGGSGALSAVHDAAALANWIVALEPKKKPDIERVFKEYYDERYPNAKEAFKTSQMFRNVVGKVTGKPISSPTCKKSIICIGLTFDCFPLI